MPSLRHTGVGGSPGPTAVVRADTFSEQGYAATPIGDIAADAGVSVPTVYAGVVGHLVFDDRAGFVE